MTNNTKLNETIKRIVGSDVLTCQSMLVDAMLEKEFIGYDDIENMYIDNSDKIEDLNNEKDTLENEQDEKLDKLQEDNDTNNDENDFLFDTDEITEIEHNKCKKAENTKYENDKEKLEKTFEKQTSEIEDQISELENEQDEPQEAYEWWAVSEWLEGKLRANNEILLVTDYGTWWGRQTSGQAIEMDYIMEKIATDLN